MLIERNLGMKVETHNYDHILGFSYNWKQVLHLFSSLDL